MRKRQRSIFVLALVIVASLCFGSVAAQAHNLPPRIAKKGAREVAKNFAENFAAQGDTDVAYGAGKCSKRTAHRYVCTFFVEGVDGNGPYLCRGFAIVRFVSASSTDVIAKSQSKRLACAR